jgi:16S rRNA (guanine527-N7)-methyltransferase
MNWLAEQAAVFNLPLTAGQQHQFTLYQELLLTWNERMNLTAVREPQQIQERHFLDSLSCATVTGNLNCRSLIDVGTGAGFPGLPLKILFPKLQLVLVESVAKKTEFLQAVVAVLELPNVEIIAERSEILGQSHTHREQYDWVTARGVAELRVLAEYLLPLCRVGGHALAQKGDGVQEEVQAAETAVHTLGGAMPKICSIQLPTRKHYLVLIEKVASTPLKFPRRVGIPAKRPL